MSFGRVNADVCKVVHLYAHRHHSQAHEKNMLGRRAVIARARVVRESILQITPIVIMIAKFDKLHANVLVDAFSYFFRKSLVEFSELGSGPGVVLVQPIIRKVDVGYLESFRQRFRARVRNSIGGFRLRKLIHATALDGFLGFAQRVARDVGRRRGFRDA